MFRRLTGNSRSSCDPRLSACSDIAVSIRGEYAVTVRVSDIAPTSSVNVWRTICPAPSRMPRWMTVLKPVSSRRTVYGPPGNAENTNSPLASVTASRDTPVPSWVASTLAPGITAVELSRTIPTSVAVVTCASTRCEDNSKRAVMPRAMQSFAPFISERKRQRRTFMGPTSLKCRLLLRKMVDDERLLLGAFDPFQDRGVFRRVFGEADAAAVRQGRGPGDALRLGARRRFTENQAVLGICLVHHIQSGRERRVEQRVRRMAMHAGIAV